MSTIRRSIPQPRPRYSIDTTAIVLDIAFGSCRICSCNNLDCRGCVKLFGRPCHWANKRRDVCSACEMG